MSAVIAAGCARRGAEKRREMQHQMAAGRKAAERKATRKVRRDAASEEQCVADAGRALKVLTAATTLDELSDALRRGNLLKSYLPELKRAIPKADKRLEEMLTVEEMRPANEELTIDDYDEFMPRVDPVRMLRAEARNVLEVGTDASQDDMFGTARRREAFMRWQLDQNQNPDDPEAPAEAATRPCRLPSPAGEGEELQREHRPPEYNASLWRFGRIGRRVGYLRNTSSQPARMRYHAVSCWHGGEPRHRH